MKTLSKTILLLSALSVSAFLGSQTFAEGVAMPGANLIAYHGVDTGAGQVVATAVAMPGANLIAYQGAAAPSAEATGSFCTIASASNFSAGAIGLLSARSSC